MRSDACPASWASRRAQIIDLQGAPTRRADRVQQNVTTSQESIGSWISTHVALDSVSRSNEHHHTFIPRREAGFAVASVRGIIRCRSCNFDTLIAYFSKYLCSECLLANVVIVVGKQVPKQTNAYSLFVATRSNRLPRSQASIGPVHTRY